MSTCNLVDSHLVPNAYAMEDAVIGALNKKSPHFGGAKGGSQQGGSFREAPQHHRENFRSENPTTFFSS